METLELKIARSWNATKKIWRKIRSGARTISIREIPMSVHQNQREKSIPPMQITKTYKTMSLSGSHCSRRVFSSFSVHVFPFFPTSSKHRRAKNNDFDRLFAEIAESPANYSTTFFLTFWASTNAEVSKTWRSRKMLQTEYSGVISASIQQRTNTLKSLGVLNIIQHSKLESWTYLQ